MQPVSQQRRRLRDELQGLAGIAVPQRIVGGQFGAVNSGP